YGLHGTAAADQPRDHRSDEPRPVPPGLTAVPAFVALRVALGKFASGITGSCRPLPTGPCGRAPPSTSAIRRSTRPSSCAVSEGGLPGLPLPEAVYPAGARSEMIS